MLLSNYKILTWPPSPDINFVPATIVQEYSAVVRSIPNALKQCAADNIVILSKIVPPQSWSNFVNEISFSNSILSFVEKNIETCHGIAVWALLPPIIFNQFGSDAAI